MTFIPEPSRSFNAPLIECLAVQPGRDAANQPVAVLTIRFLPSVSFKSHDFCLTQSQAVRLRDDLNSLLTTAESWLFVGKE